MAAKDNFFKAHWDWLVALAGIVALGGAVALLLPELDNSPDSAAQDCADELRSIKPAHDGVAAVDTSVLENALKTVNQPPALSEVDGKKASFLGSERRIACRAGEGKDPKKACGRPIPAELTKCPFCGMEQPALVKIEVDSDHDGLPNDWEVKYGFNKDDGRDAALDADKDGFTNLEEFTAGTDPKDAKSHPDYMDFLALNGGLQQTFLPFYFKQANPVGKSFRLTFQRLDVKSKFDLTLTAVVGEEIKSNDGKYNSGYTAKNYVVKDVEVPAYKGSKMMKKIKVGFVDIVRKDGKALTIREGVRRIPVESQAEVVFNREGGKTFTVSVGTEFEIHGVKYKVISLQTKDGKAAVTIQDLSNKKQKIVLGA